MSTSPSSTSTSQSGPVVGGAAPRRSQEERAAQTRGVILDATVASLIEDGYAATTTNAVQRRAGISRGALMHHFPSKQDLLLDAVAHLAIQRGLWLTEQAARLPADADRQAAVIDLLWRTMTGPLFAAATELWIAARTDEDLRTALIASERRLGEGARLLLADLFGVADPDDADFRRGLDLVLQVFRGASLTATLRDDERWERDLIATTTELFRSITLPTTTPTDTTPATTRHTNSQLHEETT